MGDNSICLLKVTIRNNNCLIGSHVLSHCNKMRILYTGDFPNTIPAKFGFNWQSSFRGKLFFILANQKQECLYRPCFLSILIHNEIGFLYRVTSRHHLCKIVFQLPQQFQKRIFFFCILANRKQECLYWPCFFIRSKQNEKFLQSFPPLIKLTATI